MAISGNTNGVEITNDNSKEIIAAMDAAKDRFLTMIGIKIERYAKALCPVGTAESTGKKGYRGGTLRNSITFQVEDDMVAVGTNVEYAPYVELGTGPYFTPPPSWEQFESQKGAGIGHGYVRPRPYLRPAVENHINEFQKIIETELKK